MLIGSLVAGIVLGLIAGGRIENLASARLRLVQALFFGLFLRYAVEFAIESGNDIASGLRLPLFTIGFLFLLAGLWANRELPGIPLAFVGIVLNAVAVTTNAGYMPVWQPSILAAGLPLSDVGTAFHKIVGLAAGGGISGSFLTDAGPLGDIIPIPVPGLRNVASIGDIFLAAGLAFFLFATTVRSPAELEAAAQASINRRFAFLGRRGPVPTDATTAVAGAQVSESTRLVSASSLERPLSFGGSSLGAEAVLAPAARPFIPGLPQILERVQRHPYVRLALDSSFSALWTGQLISLFGDRIHQVALAFLILRATNSPIAVGAVFLVATLPNLLFGPIAGTLVDRWDHREVMIVSDLLRAGIVLLIPIAAVVNLALVYPLVFLVTTISIFFRPAKGAILPRLVASEDLVAANSALWVSETFADIAGYAIAGLFVALLGSQLPLAFWVDSVTYVGSAILIASIAVAPVVRGVAAVAARLTDTEAREAEAEAARESAAAIDLEARLVGDTEVASREGHSLAGEADVEVAAESLGFFGELKAGWRFLRGEQVLLANTIQATFAQLMIGILLALMPVYASDVLRSSTFDDTTIYSFLEAAIGAGNLIGGFVIGVIGARLALGRAVILGYAATGLAVFALALTNNPYVAIGLAFGTGVANLAFVIPSQTLFQRRTPPELMGRVLSFRFSLVFGAMTLAMGVGGVLGQLFGSAPVIGVFGLVTVAAGLAGALVPAVREA
ncbi:MAG TPA: MFS transporter [Candidatus Limnocylindrales bacterium]|nr:MFS transporter [Candidatus Limnocylindrales bacterium]